MTNLSVHVFLNTSQKKSAFKLTIIILWQWYVTKISVFIYIIFFYRDNPPTTEEIEKNIAIAKMKQENAAQIEIKRLAEGGSVPAIPERGAQSFPKYEDLPSGDPDNIPGRR